MDRGIRQALGALLCLISMSALEGAEAPGKHQLRYQFPQGETLNYVSQHDARIKVTFPTARETVSHTSMSLRSIRVVSSTPGVAQVEHTIHRARMTADNGQGVTLYDSQKPGDVPVEFQAVHQSIGKPLPARLSVQGKAIAGAAEDAAIDHAELFFHLPEEPVAVGAPWNERYEAQVEVEKKLYKSVRMERRFELLSVENGIATIGLATVCLSPMNDPAQEVQILQKSPKGQFQLEIATGHLLERQLVIDGNVINFQGPGTQMVVKSLRVDRLIAPDKVAQVDLTKPLIPVQVAEEAGPEKK